MIGASKVNVTAVDITMVEVTMVDVNMINEISIYAYIYVNINHRQHVGMWKIKNIDLNVKTR